MRPDNFIFSDFQTFEVKFTLEYCKKSPVFAVTGAITGATGTGWGHYGGIIRPQGLLYPSLQVTEVTVTALSPFSIGGTSAHKWQ